MLLNLNLVIRLPMNEEQPLFPLVYQLGLLYVRAFFRIITNIGRRRMIGLSRIEVGWLYIDGNEDLLTQMMY